MLAAMIIHSRVPAVVPKQCARGELIRVVHVWYAMCI